jgi:predicted phage replisome organizer
MADNRKYYYLKLKENFFDSDSIVLLEDMKDGILYSNILLKLYLKSLKNGGKLQLDEHIPYTAQMIATLTRHQIGTVERALEIFRQLGLVEQLDSGAFYMTDIELMIGQSSTEAERKRAARLENKALLPPRTKGGHLSDIRPPEIELEKEKEIEIEKEREGETGHPVPAAYGRYNNVILTDTELSGLKTELTDKWEYYIDRLSCHIASTGKQYHSHAATIYKWAQEDAAKAGNIFVPALKAGGKVIEYRCKICHANGNLFFHKGVGDTGGKVAFSCPHATPKQVADIFSLHGFPALHIKAGGFGLWVSAVVMLKCPVPHSRVSKAPAFQVLHFFKVLLSAFGGLLLFTGCPLAVAVCWVAVTPETSLSLCKIGFFGRMALTAV